MHQQVLVQTYPLFLSIWLHRYLLFIPTLIMPIIILIFSYLSEPKYEAQTTILVQETALMNPFLEDLSISFNIKERIDALRLMAHSHLLLSDVIRELKLVDKNNINEISLMVKKISINLEIQLIGSDVIRMTLTWTKPEQMEGIINAISKRFLYRLKSPGQTSVVSSEEFLAQQLNHTQKELESAESELADFKLKYANNLPLLQNNHAMNGSQLEGRLRETELKLLRAKTKRANLYKRLEHINPIIGILEKEIINYQAKLTILRANYTDQHSKVKSVIKRLQHLKTESNRLINEQRKLTPQQIEQLWQRASNVTQNTNGTKGNNVPPILLSQLEQLQNAETDIDSLSDEMTLLKTQIDMFSTQRENFAELEKELKILERNYKVKSVIYNKLLERYEMANITSKLGEFEEQDKLKIIEGPTLPLNTSKRPWFINLLIGLIAGIGVGASLTTLSIIADTRIYHPIQLSKLTNIPILTIIPKIKAEDPSN